MKRINTLLGIMAAAATALPIAAGMPPAAAAAPAAQGSECYRTFWPSGHQVEISACEYGGGSTSGYTVLRNRTNRDMYVCWTLHYGNGREFKGCNFRVRPGDEARSSCYSCNRRQGGLKDVTWRTVKPSD